MTRAQAEAIRKKVVDGELVEAAGGIKTNVVQSDKLGFDWKRTFVNDVLVKSEYIEQEVKMGTADNPIIWTEDVECINNAYYLKDGVRVVYMDGEFIEF